MQPLGKGCPLAVLKRNHEQVEPDVLRDRCLSAPGSWVVERSSAGREQLRKGRPAPNRIWERPMPLPLHGRRGLEVLHEHASEERLLLLDRIMAELTDLIQTLALALDHAEPPTRGDAVPHQVIVAPRLKEWMTCCCPNHHFTSERK